MSDHPSDMSPIKIDESGMQAQLLKLNPHKATGPDDIFPQLLKQMATVISPALTRIFQQSLDSGKVPDDWRKACVCAVFNKGDKYLLSNYRPINLTCVSRKILEHITSNLAKYLENQNKLTSRQHGFRSCRSCASQLIEFTSDISQMLDNGGEVLLSAPRLLL